MFKKIAILFSLIFPSTVLAQAEASGSQSSNVESLLYVVIGLVLVISILVLLVAVYTLFVLRIILSQEQARAIAEGAEIVPKENY